MPRDGSNVYSADWTPAQPNTPISSGNANAMVNDLVEDANLPRPISAGGTGQSTAVAASDALGGGSATVSSAATTNIVATSSQNVTVSGSTTITAFSTASAGVKRYLTFSGSLTLTHNGTSLILPGSVNIQTAAGDTAIAQSLGSGNWRISHYTKIASKPGTVPASETEPGIVEKATPAELRSAEPDKYIATDLIETASAMVTLTDASTIAVDWDTFINGQVTIAADRILGNPTNGQPGTYRTILLKGDSDATRELTFGTQYLGIVPEGVRITDQVWYLLTIRCITSTHFIASAQVARL